MGRPKLLMPLNGMTVLEQTVNIFLNSRVNETIVVLGYKADEAMKKLANKQVRTVINRAYRQGISTSIKSGIAAISPQAGGVMFGLGDTPFVDSQTINRLLEEFSEHEKGIVIPLYRGIRGHPKIFPVKYKDELMKLTGDTTGLQIIQQNPEDVLEVPVECEGVIQDIDTTGQYRFYSRSQRHHGLIQPTG